MKKVTLTILFSVTFSYLYCANFKDMDKLQEIWMPIQALSNHYEISNQGKIRSLDRSTLNRNYRNRVQHFKGRVLRTSCNRDGYVMCYPTVEGEKFSLTIHRLVAFQYVANPDNLPEVNHIDGNKNNNAWWNLEWCTRGDNMRHAHKNGLVKFKLRGESPEAKKVFQLSLSGDFIAEYPCVMDAQDATGVGFRQISAVATGKRITTHGLKFTYTDPRL